MSTKADNDRHARGGRSRSRSLPREDERVRDPPPHLGRRSRSPTRKVHREASPPRNSYRPRSRSPDVRRLQSISKDRGREREDEERERDRRDIERERDRRGTERERDRDRDYRERRGRSRSRSDSRGRDKREMEKARDRDRDTREKRRRSRSPSDSREGKRERRRDRSREKRRRSRTRSDSRSSASSSDSERRRHRRRKEKHKKRRSRSRSRDRDKKGRKRDKKDKKKKSAAVGNQWGKHGIITETDIYTKEQEFRAWLVEERMMNPETMSKDQTKKEFARFVEDFNTATLPHEKFYHMEAYERRMSALRAGEYVPPAEDSYNPAVDMQAHQSQHKRKNVEHESYLSKEQLQDLRRVQQERIEAGKMKLLGMDIKQNMGVRMDGTVFDG
ncbi:hypothetical protein EW146_g4109 [Bondarzewia mesenterica]|uniref:Uncharacterized protein n=1 Tax=Bondarzewia mesenterica TaxID=1095465 RepID=A0A4S4M1D9_9AGAM|nr:hypothetical protein EW146_g4109 [Bondarzewia mesenterica]